VPVPVQSCLLHLLLLLFLLGLLLLLLATRLVFSRLTQAMNPSVSVKKRKSEIRLLVFPSLLSRNAPY
jgi:hypothetical protein